MKKVIYVGAFLFLGAMALTSCKKDYTCDCRVAGNTVQEIPFNDYKKKDAEDGCKKAEETYSNFGDITCTLK